MIPSYNEMHPPKRKITGDKINEQKHNSLPWKRLQKPFKHFFFTVVQAHFSFRAIFLSLLSWERNDRKKLSQNSY